MDGAAVAILAGLILGLGLGATAAATDFCTFGGIVDWAKRRDSRRLRSWALATAVALAGAQALHLAGLVDLGKAFQRGPNLFWLGAILGGLLFGWGMTLTGGCGLRLLVRAGGGSQRALAGLLTLGLAAYATQRGVLAPLRQFLESTTLDLRGPGLSGQGLPDLAAAAGLSPTISVAAPSLALALGLAGWSLASAAFRASPRHVLSGLAVGLLVVGGWYATGVLAADDFEPQPLRSLSYVAPIGASLAYVMTSTGASLDFAVASIAGTILGAALVFRLGRRYAEDPISAFLLARHLWGGILMGTGGVLAGGCTIGQGITGLSTLSAGAVLATAAIAAGSVAALGYELRRQ